MRRCLSVLVLAGAAAFAASPKIGVFEGQSDIGAVLHPGTAAYDAATRVYKVAGSGENMWFANDEFHFVWKKVQGDVAIEADIAIVTRDGDNHRKAALMIRQALDNDAAYADASLHGDGLTSLQTREAKSEVTREIQSRINGPKHLRLEKRGDWFYMSVDGAPSGGWLKVPMKAPFYIGLAVCAHNKNNTAEAAFSNVQVVALKPGPTSRYSTLEMLTVSSTDRRALYIAKGTLRSPVWTRDAACLIFGTDNGLERLDIATGKRTPIYLAGLNPERWSLSPDGTTLELRAGDKTWRAPVEGGIPQPAPTTVPTAGEGFLSPDGLKQAYLTSNSTLEMRTLADGKVKLLGKLLAGPATFANPGWSPDSRRIAFVSYQDLPD